MTAPRGGVGVAGVDRGRGGVVERLQLAAVAHERAEVGQPGEVEVADRVGDQQQHEVPRRLDQRGEEREVHALGGLVAVRGADLAARRISVSAWASSRRAAASRGRLREQQPARLHHRAQHLAVLLQPAAERVHQHVQPAVGAPVADPHRVAVTDLDQVHLLEPLDALADGRHVDAELGREGALRGQPLARRVPAGEHVGGELSEARCRRRP